MLEDFAAVMVGDTTAGHFESLLAEISLSVMQFAFTGIPSKVWAAYRHGISCRPAGKDGCAGFTNAKGFDSALSKVPQI